MPLLVVCHASSGKPSHVPFEFVNLLRACAFLERHVLLLRVGVPPVQTVKQIQLKPSNAMSLVLFRPRNLHQEPPDLLSLIEGIFVLAILLSDIVNV